jgi:DMSO/TMAO reductase YedYZ molybdopterin-dependent catalytic subunit
MQRNDGDADGGRKQLMARRQFVQRAGAGALTVAFGGTLCYFADDLTSEARAETRSDGRRRLPPGQRVLQRLKPMGGDAGDANPARFRLRVYGEVRQPFFLSFKELLELPQVERSVDVHCVTGWSVLGARFKGVSVRALAERAQLKASARFLIIEAAHGYTANVSLQNAMKPNVLVAHRLDGDPLPRAHGAPVRAVVPDLYFWKSAKWLTGLRFVSRDEPGYWETRGYNNHADPWKEERHAG